MALSTAAACPSCVFGAVGSITLSFTHPVETITVSKIPLVTVYSNGHTITNYETITNTVPAVTSAYDYITYSDINNITWTVGDATLTYPTQYVQYVAFFGAAASKTAGGESCALGADATPILLPSATNVASLIYPVTGEGSMPLPTPLLQYLDTFGGISAQLGGDNLIGCAPLQVSEEAPRKASEDVPPEVSSVPSPGACGSQPQQPIAERALSDHSISVRRHYANTTTASSSGGSPSLTSSLASSNGTTASTLPRSSSAVTIGSSTISLGCPNNSTTDCSSHTVTGVAPSTSNSSQSCPTVPPTPPPPPPPPPPTTHPSAHSGHAPDTSTAPLVDHHTTAYGVTTVTGHPIVVHATGKPPKQEPKETSHLATSNHNHPSHLPAPSELRHSTHTGHDPPADTPQPTTASAVWTLGRHTTVTNQPGTGVVLGHHTLRPGHTVIVGSGASRTTLALHTQGGTTHLVVDGTTRSARPESGETRIATEPTAVITANGHTITAIKLGNSMIIEEYHSKTTVGPGSVVTIDGQTISVPMDGSSIIVNGKMSTSTRFVSPATEAVMTTKGQTFTAIYRPGSIVLEDTSSTLTMKDGSAGTFEGLTVSAARTGNSIVVKGQTTKLTPTTVSTSSTSGSSRSKLVQNSAAARHCSLSMIQMLLVGALSLMAFLVVL